MRNGSTAPEPTAELQAQAEREEAANAELTSAALEAADQIRKLNTFLAEQAAPQTSSLKGEVQLMREQLEALRQAAAAEDASLRTLSDDLT